MACPASELVRIVAPDGVVRVLPARRRDPAVAGARGRGAWLHPRESCLAAAVKSRAFGRAFRRQLECFETGRLWAEVRMASDSSHEQGDS
jgi:hypothetical protein